MADATPALGTGWEIMTVVQKVAPSAAGILTQGNEITFKTSSGDVGTVFLPQAQFSVENARTAVAQQALVMDQVKALKG